MPSVTTIAMTRSRRPTIIGCVLSSSPHSTPTTGGGPRSDLVSLFKDADRAKCNVIEALAAKLEKVVDDKTKTYMEAAIKKELAKFPEPLRTKLRAALDVAPASRSDEQKRLLASNPSVNITEGVLYQYDPAAAEDLKKEIAKVAAKRAEKPVEDFVSVLDEVPGVLPATKDLSSRRPPSTHEIGPTRRPQHRCARGHRDTRSLKRTPLRPPPGAGSPTPGISSTGTIPWSARDSRESNLAESFRPWIGRHARRLRRAWHAPDPSGIAGLAGR